MALAATSARVRTLLSAGVVAIALVSLAACEPTLPPGVTAAPTAGAGATEVPGATATGGAGGLEPGVPVVTMDGTIVTVRGLAGGRSPEFELPAGSAEVTLPPCEGASAAPFVTFFDANNARLALIVDPTYTLNDLAGGGYYVDVAANPRCVWTITITPG